MYSLQSNRLVIMLLIRDQLMTNCIIDIHAIQDMDIHTE